MATAQVEKATENPGIFSVVKNWISDLSVSWRSAVSSEAESAGVKGADTWATLSAPRLSASGTIPGRRNFAHKVMQIAEQEISEGRGPVTMKTNDPRVKQVLRDMDAGCVSERLGEAPGSIPLSVRRVMKLDARQHESAKLSRSVLRRQLEDIEAALQMGERVVVKLESPRLASDKELQVQLKRLLRTGEYRSGGKLLLKVDGEQQDAVWGQLRKSGFVSQKEKGKKTSSSAPTFTVERPEIDASLKKLDATLQDKLRDIGSDTPPKAVTLRINNIEEFSYAEKHIRRLQRLYGPELLQVRVASGLVNQQIAEYRDSQKQRAEKAGKTEQRGKRPPPLKPAPNPGQTMAADEDIAAEALGLTRLVVD